MRVAVDATALLDPPTGIGAFVRALVDGLAGRALAGEDLELRLYAVTWRGRDLEALTRPGAHLSPVRIPARLARALWPRIDAPPVSWLAGRVDVVHGPSFVVPPGRLLPWGRGAAEVVTVHDLTPVRFPEMCTADTLQYPALVARAIARGAHVHAVSQFVADEVRACWSLPADRVTVVPNGVDADLGRTGDAAAGREAAGHDRYVLALGTVEPRKDLPGLVAAFDLLATERPDLGLVLAGPDGWGADALTAAIERSPARARIRRLGWVDERTRADLLRGATVLAYPSVYEGFGLPPLEAMAAGTPVVTTTAGALPETVGDAAVLVEAGDPAALAAGIAGVVDDPTVAADLVTRGHRHVARFSWATTVDGLLALYRRLAV